MNGGTLKSSSSVAVLAAIGLLTGGLATTPAAAADLGGNCCADLEERVADLEATTVDKGNRRVSLTLSGQVNTAIMIWDSGDDDDIYVVDNAVSPTYFELDGSARISPDLTAGFEISISIDRGARSHQVSQKDDDGALDGAGDNDSTIVMRRASWFLDHKALGRLEVGRIDTASSGITTVDLGGAGVVANASIGYWQRSFRLSIDGKMAISTWGDLLGGNSVNGASLSRGNAISYTSPTVRGFSVEAAWGEDDIWDVALRYAGEHAGFRFAAAIGHISNSTGLNEVTPDQKDGREPSQWKGSASIMHLASGLFLSGSYVNQDQDSSYIPDVTLWYIQAGIARNWTSLGKTVLYGEYARVEDGGLGIAAGPLADEDSSEATMWGLGIVQHIDAAAMEVFLSYRLYSGESERYGDTTHFDDFSAVMSGARIRF